MATIDSPLVRYWLQSPGMLEPRRVARRLGHDPDAHLPELLAQITEEELAGWLRAALAPRR